MTAATAQVVTDLRSRLQRLYGERLVELKLFGSRARGDARPDSDYDVLVILRGPVEPARERLRASSEIADVCLDYDAVVTCVFRSEEALLNFVDPFLENALHEGVTI